MRNIYITAQSRSGHNFIANQLESWGLGPIVKLEGYPPGYFTYELAKQINPHMNEPSKDDIHIIVHRDLFNWFASYLTWIIVPGHGIIVDDDHLDQQINVWKKIMQEAFGTTNFLTNKMVCDFNSFKNSQGYRMRLCLDLGGKYTEDRLNTIMPTSDGSSFTRFEYQGKANEMDTDHRYKLMLNSPIWKWYWDTLQRNWGINV